MSRGPQPLSHKGLTRSVHIVRDILASPAAGRMVLAVPFTRTPPIAALMT